MCKILIIPDIHGRDFWKKPCYNWDKQIIFLGDYHDPYYYISNRTSLLNLRELSNFVINRNKDNPNSVICLLGNHELPYYTGNYKCRFDEENKDEVLSLIKSLNPRVIYKSLCVDKNIRNLYLFSHAGVTLDWLKYNNLTLADDLFVPEYLEQIPYSRGGRPHTYGSCIWNSLGDYMLDNKLPEYYQIFGHTWEGRTKPVIEKDYAMLDCSEAFVLDTKTKELRKYEN